MNFRNEQAFLSAVVDLAKMSGWLVHHDRMRQNVQGTAGFPDLCMVRDRVIFAELKMPKGKVSQEQKEWLLSLSKLTTPRLINDHVQYRKEIEVYLWFPDDWNSIVRALGVLRET